MRHSLFIAGWAAVLWLPIETAYGQALWPPQAVADYGQAWNSSTTYMAVGGEPATAAAIGPMVSPLDYYPGHSPNDSCGLCRTAWDGYCAEIHRIGCKDHRTRGSECGNECGDDSGRPGFLHGLHWTRRAPVACCGDPGRQGCSGSQHGGNRSSLGVFHLFGNN
ncbi:MAG: hypothetical protein BMS9Abin04_459 [Planctomycetia bacterium]|nr:MAG: hypothetical protein BMS9Abin04_459 [Planctomycetia bacterium]